MRNILIGAAAVALAASASLADPGGGKGGGQGNGKGGGQAAAGPANPGKGNGGGGNGGGQARAEKPQKAQGGPAMRAEKADRGPQRQAQRAEFRERRGNGNGKASRADVGNGGQRDNRNDAVREVRAQRGGDRDARAFDRDGIRVVDFSRERSRGLIPGCPPGLAKKNNGCTPPGLAKQGDNPYRSAYYQPSWFGYSSLGDGRYYYDDGYLYRTSNTGSILGYVPLLGGALSVGNPWPDYYEPTAVPDYYVDYYNLGNPQGYRYADDVLYRVDPQTDTISSIAALLTGDQFGVGQSMPAGYDVYNVPYAYQDRYVDGPDAYYRYADGYVYQADPQTQLVEAVIELLT